MKNLQTFNEFVNESVVICPLALIFPLAVIAPTNDELPWNLILPLELIEHSPICIDVSVRFSDESISSPYWFDDGTSPV